MTFVMRRKGWLFHVNRCVAAAASIGTVLLGVPVRSAVAQAPIEGTTPQLLREPEWRFEGDCESFLQKAEQLKRGLPVQKDAIDKTRAMLDAARSDSKEAFDKAKQALYEKAQEKAKDLVLDKAKQIAKSKHLLEKGLSELMKKANLTREQRKALMEAKTTYEKLEKATDEMHSRLEKVVNLRNQAADFRLATVNTAQDSCKTVSELAAQLNKQFVDSGLAENLGSTLAAIGGPATEIGFELGQLAIMAGVDALNGAIISQRDIPTYEKNLEIMENSLRGIEGQIAEANANYRDCLKEQAKRKEFERQKQELAQRTPVRIEAPPRVVEAPPSTAPATSAPAGPDPGIVVLGVLGAGAAVAGAVALAGGLPTMGTTSQRCWMDTGSGYQSIGGASRIGPYSSLSECQTVQRNYSMGGRCWCE